MTTLALDPEEEDDLQAAEYVLGVQDLTTRRDFERRITEEPKLAALVRAWEDRLEGLNLDFSPATLPEDMLERIETRLFAPDPPARRLRGDLRLWSGLALAALVLVAYLVLTPAQPELVATLADGTGALHFAASITEGRLSLRRVAGAGPDAAHSYELWLIVGQEPPVSLGVLPEAGETISLPGAGAGAVLAVSLEPLGGSASGKPSGPVLALGTLAPA